MNKKNIFQILLITGCLSLICLLGACNEEDSIVNNQVIINGNTAILTFTVGESDFNSEQINTRSAVPNDTVRQELGDGYVIETVIVPDTVSALTRATTSSTNTVKDQVKILVIAYRGENLYKREVATVVNGKFAIHLPPGETFKLLFYSHNEPNTPAPTEYCSTDGWTQSSNQSESGEGSYFATDGATINVVENETARDMMWATANVTVTSTTRLEEINFKHLFCKVILNVTCDDDMTALTAVISPKAFSNAKVDISANPNEEDNNHRWVGMGTLKETKIESIQTEGAKELGGQTDLIPNESGNITLGYEKITINGQDYKTTTPKDLGLIFTRGHRYIITSKVKKDDLVTITYHPNGGTGDDKMLKYKRGTNIVLPEDTFVPPLEHVLYTWNTQPNGGGQDYENGENLTLTSNIDLYAIWKNPCVPGYDGYAYFWDAQQPFTGTYNAMTATNPNSTAKFTAKNLPYKQTLDLISDLPRYNNVRGSFPQFKNLLDEISTGGQWVPHPNYRDKLAVWYASLDNVNRRPSNKFLCDYYMYFPCRGIFAQRYRITASGITTLEFKYYDNFVMYYTQNAENTPFSPTQSFAYHKVYTYWISGISDTAVGGRIEWYSNAVTATLPQYTGSYTTDYLAGIVWYWP